MHFFKSILLTFSFALFVMVCFAQEADTTKIKNNKIRAGASAKDTISTPSQATKQDTLQQLGVGRVKKTKKTDTLELTTADSLAIQKHSPKKAVLMSAALPGLGQIYNKKYWKAPIAWALIGTGVYFVISNRTQYQKVRRSYLARVDSTSGFIDAFPDATDNALLESIEYNRKNMELAYIGTALAYVLNLVDASVDAHLFHFDVSDDLSLKVTPDFTAPNLLLPKSTYSNTFSAGVTFTLKL